MSSVSARMCHVMGVYEKEGARQVDDNEYFEVE